MPYDPNRPINRMQADANQAYKKLARKLHPDHGGSTEDMQALNLLKDAAESAQYAENPEVDFSVDAAGVGDDDSPLSIDGVVIPREASARIRTMSQEERAQWNRDRLRCKTDQLFLSGVLGLDLVETPHRALFAQFISKHPGTPLAELDPIFKRRMILWARGHAKTVSTRVEMAQWILNYPNIRICFLTGGDKLAKRQLAALKAVFEKPTAEFLRLFPEYCLKSVQNKRTGEWLDVQASLGNAHDFTVPCRTSLVFAEPTFAISTARSVKAGSHYDVIFVDDLVNDENYRNAKALEKSYEDYLNVVPLLDPAGYLLVTGTRYSFGDAYETIQETAKAAGEMSLWKFSIRDCWSSGNCITCGHAEVFHDRDVNIIEPPCTACECKGFVSDGIRRPLFPQVKTRDGRLFGFTLEILDKIKAELGPAVFANQYENKPIAGELQTFTEALIGQQTLHHEPQLPNPMMCDTFLVGDLAYSDTEGSDLSVIFTVRKYRGELFVVGCEYGHWRSNELVETLLRVVMFVRPNAVWLEKPAGPADALDNLIRARGAQLGIQKLPIEWIKVSNQKNAKATRIANLVQVLDSHRLWLFAQMNGYDDLVKQAIKYPRVKNDDFLDTLARVVEVPSGWVFETVPTSRATGGWLEKLGVHPESDDANSGGNDGTMFCM